MTILLQSFLTIIGCIGFGILFNIRGKKLFYASIGGGISWFFYLICLKYTNSTIISLFIASISCSVYSEILARYLKTPVTTIVISSIIPLVPGAGMYYTMYEAIQGNIATSVELGLNTIASAGSIALGVIFVSTITKQINKSKKIKN